MNVSVPLRIACWCGEAHVPWIMDNAEPAIACPLAPLGYVARIDTRYVKLSTDERGARRVYTDYDGPLWIHGPVSA